MNNLTDIQSTRKLYHIIKSKIRSKKIANVIEKSIIFLFIIIYKLLAVCVKNKNEKNVNLKIENYIEPNFKENKVMNIVNTNSIYDVSILVPVYNVEKYLKLCVESLINQKTKYKYEIVFVNDGSKDNSRKILKEYEHKSNILILDQNNKGLAETRNVLLSNAKGRYVFFIDSDDILQEDAIEKMMNEARENDYDLVQTSYYKFNEHNKKNVEFQDREIINDKYSSMQLPRICMGKIG